MKQIMNKEEFAEKHFIRTKIEEDLEKGKVKNVHLRFPPEPNGYLHIGHAKSICLNFGLANLFHGQCNLRMDDTNPEKESAEFVHAIEEDIRWLGFVWDGKTKYASDYFEMLYQAAIDLIKQGLAYVDDLSGEEIRRSRGTLTEAGKESPYRKRSVEENLRLFQAMREVAYQDGEKTLRLKIDMSSSNLNLRDPVIYRIRRTHHHRAGDTWTLYPLYDFTHTLSDAFEGITHSLCTLEFEDHRPLYDWILQHLAIPNPPHQYEFSRLELFYTITSKRKLSALVEEKVVTGWNDPRLPTLAGMRRRGYTPSGIRLFCKRIGVAKSDNTVDFSLLEGTMREDLEHTVPRMMAVLDPLPIELINFDSNHIKGQEAAYAAGEEVKADKRMLTLKEKIYIERGDFALEPPPKWHRLVPGGEVRLRHSYIIKVEEVVQDNEGKVIGLKASIDYDTLGKKPEGRKVKGVIHWVNAEEAVPIKVRLYDRLFTVPNPDNCKDEAGERIDFRHWLNPNSLKIVEGYAEKKASDLKPEERWQFERLGYFVADRYDYRREAPVFNRIVSLKDTWEHKGGKSR